MATRDNSRQSKDILRRMVKDLRAQADTSTTQSRPSPPSSSPSGAKVVARRSTPNVPPKPTVGLDRPAAQVPMKPTIGSGTRRPAAGSKAATPFDPRVTDSRSWEPRSPQVERDPLVIRGVDGALPMMLLPVRLETRFIGSELRIRIYPDALHEDALARDLSQAERDAGQTFWIDSWGRSRLEAYRVLAAEVGDERAAWVARRTEPINLGRSDAKPVFGPVDLGPTTVATTTHLLPRQFVARGYRGSTLVFEERGRRVPSSVQLGPDFASDQVRPQVPGSNDQALPIDEGMRWIVDYEAAEKIGLAITVRLTGAAATSAGIDQVIVMGVRTEAQPADVANELLPRWIEGHHYTEGMAFLPQGTPTNNTDEVRSPWAPESNDERFSREFEQPTSATRRNSNAWRFGRALGIQNNRVLGALRGADDDEDIEASAMNRVVWWSLVRPTARTIFSGESGSPLLRASTLDAVENFFVSRVRGGGPLPAVRIGAQPYGILPISERWLSKSGWRRDLGLFLSRLRPLWVRAESTVPRLNPDRLDELASSPGSLGSSADAELLQILATQAHPAEIRVSQVEDRRKITKERRSGIQTQYDAAWVFAVLGANAGERYEDWRHRFDPKNKPSFVSIEAQIEWWSDQVSSLRRYLAARRLKANDDALYKLLVSVVKLLNAHRARVRQARRLTGRSNWPTGVVGADEPRILYSLFDEEDPELWANAWTQGSDGTVNAIDWLGWLRERCDEERYGEVENPGPFAEDAPRPILWELSMRAVLAAGASESSRRRARLANLRAAFDRLASVPAERLTLRLRESLGLLGPRLDAWYTALTFDRMLSMRILRPRGIYVGAYGWVEGLKPDRKRDDTQGFVHAPSLDHAAAAGVLRAGWLAFGSENPMSPAATDLSSDRIRTARVLLDGIRQGQDLGTMLGARFERSLRRRGLGELVHPYRAALDEVANRGGQLPPSPVDGELLIEHQKAEKVARVARDANLSTALEERLSGVFGELNGALDAVSDAVLAEGVYQLVRGNLARASATFEAVAAGERPPPSLEVADVARDGFAVQHRLVLLWPARWIGQTMGWSASKDPTLGAFVEHMLGSPHAVGFAVTVDDGEGGTRRTTHRLVELGLSALEYLAMAPPPDATISTELVAAIRENLGFAADDESVLVAADEPAESLLSLMDHGLLTQALKTLLANGRAAVADDLILPSTQEAASNRELRSFSMPPSVISNLAVSETRTQGGRAVEGWLRQVAKVRSGVERWMEVDMIQEALNAEVTSPARVVQWPSTSASDAPEPWAATNATAG